MKVLVGGGAGYIGSHNAFFLRRHGHEVLMYDNLSTGHKFVANRFELIIGDTAHGKTLVDAMRGIDAVMHFASDASVGESIVQPGKYFEKNVQAALGLLNIAMDSPISYCGAGEMRSAVPRGACGTLSFPPPVQCMEFLRRYYL